MFKIQSDIKKYDSILVILVDRVISKYSDQLNIDSLEVIWLKDVKEFSLPIDGRSENRGKTIIITSRLFDLLSFDNAGNVVEDETYQALENTLYHEIGHLTDRGIFSEIYNIAENENSEWIDIVVSIIWIEYVAQKRTRINTKETREFCANFINMDWEPYRVDFDPHSKSFSYLNKTIPYFMARAELIYGKYYMDNIENEVVRNYIVELQQELIKLEELIPFSEYKKLSRLKGIVEKYYMIFKKEYKR